MAGADKTLDQLFDRLLETLEDAQLETENVVHEAREAGIVLGQNDRIEVEMHVLLRHARNFRDRAVAEYFGLTNKQAPS